MSQCKQTSPRLLLVKTTKLLLLLHVTMPVVMRLHFYLLNLIQHHYRRDGLLSTPLKVAHDVLVQYRVNHRVDIVYHQLLSPVVVALVFLNQLYHLVVVVVHSEHRIHHNKIHQVDTMDPVHQDTLLLTHRDNQLPTRRHTYHQSLHCHPIRHLHS